LFAVFGFVRQLYACGSPSQQLLQLRQAVKHARPHSGLEGRRSIHHPLFIEGGSGRVATPSVTWWRPRRRQMWKCHGGPLFAGVGALEVKIEDPSPALGKGVVLLTLRVERAPSQLGAVGNGHRRAGAADKKEEGVQLGLEQGRASGAAAFRLGHLNLVLDRKKPAAAEPGGLRSSGHLVRHDRLFLSRNLLILSNYVGAFAGAGSACILM